MIGLGTWQIGGSWGEVSEADALSVLDAAVEAGVTFFDTADVYGDGRSEQLIGRFLADHPDLVITVATKMGRRVEQVPENYTLANFRTWVDRSRNEPRLSTSWIWCSCTARRPRSTPTIRCTTRWTRLVADGVIAAYGVSVETVDEALTAISRRGTATVQLILNAFRTKPLDDVLPAAAANGVGIIARVPLASGLLSGRYTSRDRVRARRSPQLQPAGGVVRRGRDLLRRRLRNRVSRRPRSSRRWCKIISSDVPPAQAALAWVVQQPGVTTVIPGARSPEQARANAAAGSLPPLGEEFLAAVADLYDRRLRASIHPRW